jgi:nicotinate-nucleotide adenylyltransferase
MRIGIFGGTFNPIHEGHVRLAGRCTELLEIDELLVIPTFLPPHKASDDMASGEHRLAMCRMALEHLPKTRVCDMEIRRGGKSFTAQTLCEIKSANPRAELILIMGSDMFFTVESWFCADVVFRLARIAAAARCCDDIEKMRIHLDRLVQKGVRADIVEIEPYVVSSGEIRSGEKTESLPARVSSYIAQNALYGCEESLDPDLGVLTDRLSALMSPKRLEHSLQVASQAVRLARRWGADGRHAYMAGLLHDICKEMGQSDLLNMLDGSDIISDKIFAGLPDVWHAHAAALFIQKELCIYHADIVNAVRYHSTGRAGMSLLEKIIYIADLISEERRFAGIGRLRKTAYQDLDRAVLDALVFCIGELTHLGKPIAADTVLAYNDLAGQRDGHLQGFCGEQNKE